MPKKFTGENTKAVAARARKTLAKESQQAQKKKDEEDRYWKDDDKHLVRKLQRKEDQEKKKQSMAYKKAEIKALLEQESAAVKSVKVPAPPKITRAQISEHVNVDVKPIKKDKIETHLDVPLEENINRILPTAEEAHTITEAIALLSTRDEELDKHPEKRMKAAYTAYEQRQLVLLKEIHPTLRLSQLKQMIFRDWQKSPENPFNQ